MKPNHRTLAAVVHELLRQHAFDSIGDLVEETKMRAARLGLPYDSGSVSEALRLVERTRPLLASTTAPRRVEPEPEQLRELTAAEATEVLTAIWKRISR